MFRTSSPHLIERLDLAEATTVTAALPEGNGSHVDYLMFYASKNLFAPWGCTCRATRRSNLITRQLAICQVAMSICSIRIYASEEVVVGDGVRCSWPKTVPLANRGDKTPMSAREQARLCDHRFVRMQFDERFPADGLTRTSLLMKEPGEETE